MRLEGGDDEEEDGDTEEQAGEVEQKARSAQMRKRAQARPAPYHVVILVRKKAGLSQLDNSISCGDPGTKEKKAGLSQLDNSIKCGDPGTKEKNGRPVSTRR